MSASISRPTAPFSTPDRSADRRFTSPPSAPKAAAVAGRQGDGLWTLADPDAAPEIIDAYRGAAEDAGREPGEILLQAAFSWAPDDDQAFEGARVWKGAQPEEFFVDDWHDPAAMYAHGEEQVERR